MKRNIVQTVGNAQWQVCYWPKWKRSNYYRDVCPSVSHVGTRGSGSSVTWSGTFWTPTWSKSKRLTEKETFDVHPSTQELFSNSERLMLCWCERRPVFLSHLPCSSHQRRPGRASSAVSSPLWSLASSWVCFICFLCSVTWSICSYKLTLSKNPRRETVGL